MNISGWSIDVAWLTWLRSLVVSVLQLLDSLWTDRECFEFWNFNLWRAWFVSIAEIGKSGPYTTPQPPYNNLFVPSHYPADPATTKDMQGDDFSDEKLRENTNCTITIYTNEKTRAIGFVSEWLNAYEFLSRK